MPGNLFPISPHSTFSQKVRNFPENIYNFDQGDDLTTLMGILLGNSGTGQLNNLQLVARIGQQNIEFSNLDEILGTILNVKRTSSEIYSFATNPFIDQLLQDDWQEIATKDARYRERLLGAAEAFQIGATAWGIVTLCQALTNVKFYVVETWRTPRLGRSGVNSSEEIVLIPLLDSNNNTGIFKWDQGYAYTILSTVQKLIATNYVVSFGTPVQTFIPVPLSDVSVTISGQATAPSGYSSYFFLQPTINANQMNTPSNPIPGSQSRYWVQNNQNSVAPFFAHLQTQEVSIDQTGNISLAYSMDPSPNASLSIANPSLSVTSTVYGAQ